MRTNKNETYDNDYCNEFIFHIVHHGLVHCFVNKRNRHLWLITFGKAKHDISDDFFYS